MSSVHIGDFEESIHGFIPFLNGGMNNLSYDGPDAANLKLWWSAVQPELSGEGADYVFTKVGTPGIVTKRGRPSLATTTTSDGYRTTVDFAPAANETWMIYVLFEAPQSKGNDASLVLAELRDAVTNIAKFYVNADTTNSRVDAVAVGTGSTNRTDNDTATNVKDTVYLYSAQLTRDAGTGWDVEAGTDATQTGSAASDTVDPPTGFDQFQIPNPGQSNSATAVRIWDAFVFDTAFNVAMAPWALGLVNRMPATNTVLDLKPAALLDDQHSAVNWTNSGAVTATDTPESFAKHTYDGVNDFSLKTESLDFNASAAVTVYFAIQTPDVSITQEIMGWRVTGDTNNALEVSFSATGEIAASVTVGGSLNSVITSGAGLANDTRYVIAVEFTTTGITIYVDGVDVGSDTFATADPGLLGQCFIGHNSRTGGYGNILVNRITAQAAAYDSAVDDYIQAHYSE